MAEATHDKGKPLVTIAVNKQPVQVEGPKISGLAIKEAAIAHGVNIQLDFQLAELHPNGSRVIVGDAEIVTVNKNSKFVATAADDNS